MNYQNLSYFLFVADIFLIVTLFIFVSNSFPGNWYKDKIHKVQFVISVLILVCAVIRTYAFFKLSSDYTYSGFFKIGVSLYVLFFDIIFIYAGFSRYFRFAKDDYKLIHISLNMDSYEMHHDIKFMPPDESVVEKVENYAITNTGDTVMFLADSPDKPTDIDCICYKVDNGIYHCTSYYELSPKISIGFIFQKMLTLFVIANAYVFPVLLVWADMHKFYLETEPQLYIMSPIMCLFGGMCIKLFYKTDTRFKYLMYLGAAAFISFGIAHYFDLFDMIKKWC